MSFKELSCQAGHGGAIRGVRIRQRGNADLVVVSLGRELCATLGFHTSGRITVLIGSGGDRGKVLLKKSQEPLKGFKLSVKSENRSGAPFFTIKGSRLGLKAKIPPVDCSFTYSQGGLVVTLPEKILE